MYSRKQKERDELDYQEYILYHGSPTAGNTLGPDPDEPVSDPNDEYFRNNPLYDD